MSKQAFNLPNLLTYARILAVPLIVLCFFIEGRLRSSDFARWAALSIFIAASVTDYLDGYLARIWEQTSNIGKMLDPIADKLLVGALLIVFAYDGTFGVWDLIPAIIILMREIFVSGLREYLGNKSITVPVSRIAKYKTTLQLIAIAALIVEPLVFGMREVSDVLLWATAALTAFTGWQYWSGALPHMRASNTPDAP